MTIGKEVHGGSHESRPEGVVGGGGGGGQRGILNFADVSFFSLAFVQHPFSVEAGLCGLWTKVNPARERRTPATHCDRSCRASERASE